MGAVQTFLPYPSFARSVRVLDRARMGKQRVEALQVLRAITVPGYGWRNHPVAKMWRILPGTSLRPDAPRSQPL
ncbi:pyrimidine dimer DNA glycosylase/endonuclease V [Leifsonia sp. SIMBA_070]|uniref:pyrimidine dimer DNA glycosylase/endonuclease V n=1 Tax=Leifsonia sp. SIMBA_070 TaxID=3085810 RepID=UPI003978204E